MNSRLEPYDLIVLGGGAAGLMCALTAAKDGRRVLLLEASNKLGKKILMSGGGRCNFTNLHTTADNFICPNPHFVKSALSQFTQWDFIAMVSAAGIAYHEKSKGQLFCDDSAKQILQLLVDQCVQFGVEIRLNVETTAVTGCFDLQTSVGRLSSNALVVATGGLSIPTLGGATGLGYRLAKQFGHQVNGTDAALVPFTLTGLWHEFSQRLSGVACPVRASVPTKEFAENLLFTHRGLSGPAILQLSNYWMLGESIEINLLPGVDVASSLCAAKRDSASRTISAWLANRLPKALVSALRDEYWDSAGGAERPLQEYKDQQLRDLGDKINRWTLVPSGTEGYRTAEVTRGGVSVDAMSSKTMQSQLVPGLYFIGEVLDVTGHLGGFNFQWAWSSGYVAGKEAGKTVGKTVGNLV